VCQGVLLKSDRGLEQILHKHTQMGWFTARSELSEGMDCLIVSSEDMMKLETVEFLLYPSYLMPVGRHAGVAIGRFSQYLTDDELNVSTEVKPLNPDFGSDAQTID
jgi:hypothetical protein